MRRLLPSWKRCLHLDSMATLSKFGHFGTHFDCMGKTFPLENCERNGVAFDVHDIRDREIAPDDIDLAKVQAGDFVLLYTGTIEEVEYGSKAYFAVHPVISWAFIDALIAKGVSMIGVDMSGLRVGKEHPEADQRRADANGYVVENLVHLGEACKLTEARTAFIVHTYPLNMTGWTGLPSRVIAETL